MGQELERCVVCESRNPVGAERCACCDYRFAPRAEPFEVDAQLADIVRIVGRDGEPVAYTGRGDDVGIRVQWALPAAMLIPAIWAFVNTASMLFGCIEWNRSAIEITGASLLLALVVYWVIARLVNHTIIRLSAGRLRTRSGPLPWRRGLDLPLDEIVGSNARATHARRAGPTRSACARSCGAVGEGSSRRCRRRATRSSSRISWSSSTPPTRRARRDDGLRRSMITRRAAARDRAPDAAGARGEGRPRRSACRHALGRAPCGRAPRPSAPLHRDRRARRGPPHVRLTG